MITHVLFSTCMLFNRKLSHRGRTDSRTVIWHENRSAHARTPHLIVGGKIANAFLPIYRPWRIKNENVKQPISALLCDHVTHGCRVHDLTLYVYVRPSVLESAKWQIRRTTDEWRGQSQLIALRPRTRPCSICESSVLTIYEALLQYLWYSQSQNK